MTAKGKIDVNEIGRSSLPPLSRSLNLQSFSPSPMSSLFLYNSGV